MVQSAEMSLQRSSAVARPALQGKTVVEVLVFTRENSFKECKKIIF
jgi:hypothetical protein